MKYNVKYIFCVFINNAQDICFRYYVYIIMLGMYICYIYMIVAAGMSKHILFM